MKKHLPWILCTIAFGGVALLVAFAISYFDIKPTGSATPAVPMADLDNPMEQITFDDDYTLKILNIGETSIMDGSTKVIGALTGGNPMSSGVFTTMGWSLISGTHYRNDGATTGLHINASEGDLLIEFQLLSDSDEPVMHTDWINNNALRSSSEKDGATFQNYKTYLESDPSKTPQPQVIFQLQDRTGGWITARGPYNDGRDKEQRSVVAFQAWPRDTKTLQFRAIHYYSEPKYFQLENPFYVDPSQAKTFVTETLPLSHKGNDFSFTLNKVTEHYHPELGRFIEPNLTKTSRFSAKKGVWQEKEIHIKLSRIEDPIGGLHHLSQHFNISDVSSPLTKAFPYPAHFKQVKLVYTISRESSYLKALTDCTIIAEAEVADNGFELILTDNTKDYGITTIKLGQILTDENGGKYTAISVSGKWTSAAQKTRAHTAGITRDDYLVGFVDNAKLSFGHSRTESSVIPTSNEFYFKKRCYYDFKPGQKIIFAMCKKIPNQQVTFTIDLPKAREIVEGATDPNEDS